MGKNISAVVRDPEALLALEPEELAGVLLQQINSLSEQELMNLNRDNYSSSPGSFVGYGPEYAERISYALMEAWVWLEREGFIALRPQSHGMSYFVTRRGKRLKSAADLQAYQQSDLLPRKRLHPLISAKVFPPFLRGDYETAVFQAFKEVEVAVRNAGGFPTTELGVNLMRKAFRVQTGPLTDPTLPEAEQEALMALFAGAIGLYKNPQSHRHVAITDAVEAVEMILLASHLLRIVDARSAKP